MPHIPRPFYREPLKKWYVQIAKKQIPLGDDPKPIRDKLGKPVAPKAVVERYHELMVAKDRQTEVVASDLVIAVIDQFLDWVHRRKAPRTYEWYKRHLTAFARALPPSLAVSKLKPNDVTRIIDAHDDWSASTKHGFARCAQRAFRWASDEGIIGRSPLIGLSKPEPEERDVVISAEDYAAMLAVIKEPNFRDLVVAAWETGARPRELRILEASYVDLANGRWVFPKKQSKGKRKPRAVYLTETALEITRRRMALHPQGALFTNSSGEAWTRWSINNAFGRLRLALAKSTGDEEPSPTARFRKSGIDADQIDRARSDHKAAQAARRKQLAKEVSEKVPAYNLGAFRHSYGDRMLKAGVDPITVANLLGHKNLAMLANTYSHLNQDPAYLREQASRGT